MTTLTPAKAREKLSSLLKRALEGDDIGIVFEGQVIALRPVNVTSTDYMETEYGLGAEEWTAVAKTLHAKAKKARATGGAKRFSGDIEDALNS